jgi:hypothetical protein
LGDIRGDFQIANGAEICVFGSDNMFGYSVVVEGYFLHAKFNFTGFDLYASFSTAA